MRDCPRRTPALNRVEFVEKLPGKLMQVIVEHSYNLDQIQEGKK